MRSSCTSPRMDHVKVNFGCLQPQRNGGYNSLLSYKLIEQIGEVLNRAQLPIVAFRNEQEDKRNCVVFVTHFNLRCSETST